jgi:hypothetical protein
MATLDHISQVWRPEISTERRTDLADLGDLLGRLDDTEPQTLAEVQGVVELRGRIEMLVDEIEISLGVDPTPIFTTDDWAST